MVNREAEELSRGENEEEDDRAAEVEKRMEERVEVAERESRQWRTTADERRIQTREGSTMAG